MRARHWMIGCLLGFAGMGSAMAMDAGARDITATSRTSASGGSRDAGSNGGDVPALNRDGSSSRRGNDADSGDADSRGAGSMGGGEHGGRISPPAATQPATLGWQSLLPGSIQ